MIAISEEGRVSGSAGLQVQFSEENLALKVASNIRLRHITIEISVSQPKVKILLFSFLRGLLFDLGASWDRGLDQGSTIKCPKLRYEPHVVIWGILAKILCMPGQGLTLHFSKLDYIDLMMKSTTSCT